MHAGKEPGLSDSRVFRDCEVDELAALLEPVEVCRRARRHGEDAVLEDGRRDRPVHQRPVQRAIRQIAPVQPPLWNIN